MSKTPMKRIKTVEHGEKKTKGREKEERVYGNTSEHPIIIKSCVFISCKDQNKDHLFICNSAY